MSILESLSDSRFSNSSSISLREKCPNTQLFLVTIKKFGHCENIHSVNPLYLVIHSAKEKNNEKYLIIDPTDKYAKVLSGIRSEIKTLNGAKELFYKKIMLELELILIMIYL